MRRGTTPLLVALLVAGPAAGAGDLPPLLDPPVRVTATPRSELPADRIVPVSDVRTSVVGPPRTPVPDAPGSSGRRPARINRASDGLSVSADAVERTADARPAARRSDGDEELLDFLTRRSTIGRGRERSSGKFGDRVRELFDPDRRREWFFSDHAFNHLATPVSSPFLFEDPRALTEVRPIFLYQKVPSPQPNFQGGHLWFFGTRASVAFTERLSLTLNKLGAVAVSPGSPSPLDSQFGFAEVWFGPKVTILRNTECGSILSGGAIFQLPVGSANVYQDTGNLSIAPYLSYGTSLTEFRRLGTLNGIVNGGYSFSTNGDRSDYFYLNGHVDIDLCNWQRVYPLLEANWIQYTTNGQSRAFSGEGRDLINFGSAAKGSNLVTGAVGARFKITEAAQLGAAFEFPLLGNRDLFQYRFTMDVVFRY